MLKKSDLIRMMDNYNLHVKGTFEELQDAAQEWNNDNPDDMLAFKKLASGRVYLVTMAELIEGDD